MNKNIQTFLGCDSDYESATCVLFGAPFDGTTSYRPGTRMASRVMRAESYGLETYSPYQDLDLEDYAVFDGGDLDLCFGNTNRVLQDIEDFTAQIYQAGKLPIMIGGEHLVTLGAVRAAHARYPDLHIVHFDAHTDLRDEYLGEPLSHAAVIRRTWDLLGDNRIYQFGIRSGERVEFEWAKQHTHLIKFTFDGLCDAVQALRGKPVYFTIDLDVLDPSIFPGTGTPEAGGVSFIALLHAILEVAAGCTVVGADVNELSPVYDQSGVSTAVACKVLRELTLALCKKHAEQAMA